MKRVLVSVTALLLAAGLATAGEQPQMLLIKSGPVELGANNSNSLSGPAIYQVDAFMIDVREVSNSDYAKFVAATSRKPAEFADDEEFNQPDQPVTGVTWADANAYCKWRGARLPNETEWEKAARSGDGRIYPWGNKFKLANAHLIGEAPIKISDYPPTDKTPHGLIGMAGGVSEWVNDIQIASGGVCGRAMSYQPGYVSDDKSTFEKLLSAGGELGTFAPACAVGREKVSPAVVARNRKLSMALARLGKPEWGMQKCAFIKGNSFNGRPHMTKLTNRMWDYTNSYAEFVGFRCAKSVNE